jgi:secreted trypsin-like serine protease
MRTIQNAAFLTLSVILAACGKPAAKDPSETMIVGGSRVSTSDAIAKSTVALVMPDGWQFCTGSLVSAKIVVTASHCLEGYEENSLYVAFGTVAQNGSYASSRLRYATRAVMNPNFDTAAMDLDVATRAPNDIAILVLNAAAPAGYAPVKMLAASDALTVGETLTLAGFGLINAFYGTSGVLRKVDVKLAKVATAAKEIEYGPSGGKSACMGDSGGPAFVKRNGKLVLVGVTSRGAGTCDADGIYTDVRQFRGWISATAGTPI